MTLMQRLRGMLTSDPHLAALFRAGIIYDSPPCTVAEKMVTDWEGATVRDPVLRDALFRVSVWARPAAVSWVFRFQDGSGVVANDEGVFVL